MQIGMVGLGRMGANMVERLLRGGHECVVYDLKPVNVKQLVKKGAVGCSSLKEMAKKLKAPRAVWVMVPSGEITEKTILQLKEVLKKNDIVIDGGNNYFKDTMRRAKLLKEKGIELIDAGTSGGVWGVERGYCLMIGGSKKGVRSLDSVFNTLAPGVGETEPTPGRKNKKGTAEKGYLHCGPVGSGHFVKMIHNGIEYGMMQAYAEGFDIMKNADFELELGEIAELWRRGSVVSSWLLDLTAMALLKDPKLKKYSGHVSDSGEGRWSVQTAVEKGVPAEVLSAALYTRFRSRQEHTFAEKILSAMREQFGGHVEKK